MQSTATEIYNFLCNIINSYQYNLNQSMAVFDICCNSSVAYMYETDLNEVPSNKPEPSSSPSAATAHRSQDAKHPAAGRAHQPYHQPGTASTADEIFRQRSRSTNRQSAPTSKSQYTCLQYYALIRVI